MKAIYSKYILEQTVFGTLKKNLKVKLVIRSGRDQEASHWLVGYSVF